MSSENVLEVDELSLYFGDPYVINKYLTITLPKIGELVKYGEKQYFNIYNGPENEGIEVNTKGEIHMVLGEKEDVIFLPSECIYQADDKSYVYVLDEQNMQSACWIEIGLVGDEYTEILSGLNEGDMVIKR